jgi:UPF0755 protein
MKLLKILFLFILFSLIIIFVYLFLNFAGPNQRKDKERFVVGLTSTESEIISDLKVKGFIKNVDLFNLFLNIGNLHNKISPGAYLISDSENIYQLVKILTSGPYQKWVIVPPGKRKEQTALIIQKALNWDNSKVVEFINKAKEGYLFPDTYLIDVSFDSGQVIAKFTNNFNEKFDTQIQKNLLAQNIKNDTAIKIASLIERESGGDSDKPIIAGILWNRLNKNMRLEIDSTIQYIQATINCGLDSDSPQLTDCTFWPILKGGTLRLIDSPYNSYLNSGLPPTPICSPSLNSIKAVANSSDTGDLYYLHSSDKVIHTAKTYKQHLQNITDFLQ